MKRSFINLKLSAVICVTYGFMWIVMSLSQMNYMINFWLHLPLTHGFVQNVVAALNTFLVFSAVDSHVYALMPGVYYQNVMTCMHLCAL